jgi:hypothetical protein
VVDVDSCETVVELLVTLQCGSWCSRCRLL